MPRLYRSTAYPHHWVVYSEDCGWQLFPARANGWSDRRSATGLHPADLFETPLWLSFNTGLWEEVRSEAQLPAA